MKTQLQTWMESMPPDEWRVKQVLVIDWFDRPLTGLCELLEPRCCLRFDILAQNTGVEADCLYRVWEVANDAVDRAVACLDVLGPPHIPSWIPSWEFDDESDKHRAESTIDGIMKSAQPTPIIIRSIQMERFLGYWLDVTNMYSEDSYEGRARGQIGEEES